MKNVKKFTGSEERLLHLQMNNPEDLNQNEQMEAGKKNPEDVDDVESFTSGAKRQEVMDKTTQGTENLEARKEAIDVKKQEMQLAVTDNKMEKATAKADDMNTMKDLTGIGIVKADAKPDLSGVEKDLQGAQSKNETEQVASRSVDQDAAKTAAALESPDKGEKTA